MDSLIVFQVNYIKRILINVFWSFPWFFTDIYKNTVIHYTVTFRLDEECTLGVIYHHHKSLNTLVEEGSSEAATTSACTSNFSMAGCTNNNNCNLQPNTLSFELSVQSARSYIDNKDGDEDEDDMLSPYAESYFSVSQAIFSNQLANPTVWFWDSATFLWFYKDLVPCVFLV